MADASNVSRVRRDAVPTIPATTIRLAISVPTFPEHGLATRDVVETQVTEKAEVWPSANDGVVS